MHIKDLAARIKQSNPALGKIPDNRISVVLRQAFKVIREEIESTNEQTLNVALLGRFRAREIPAEKNKGKAGKRFFFSPAKANPAKATAAKPGKGKTRA